MQKSRFSASTLLHRVLSTLRPPGVINASVALPMALMFMIMIMVMNTVPPDRGKLVTLIAGSKRRRLLMAGDDDEVFMTRSLNVTPKTAEQYLIVRNCKSEAEVTNNRRVRSRYCSIEANY